MRNDANIQGISNENGEALFGSVEYFKEKLTNPPAGASREQELLMILKVIIEQKDPMNEERMVDDLKALIQACEETEKVAIAV